MPATWITNHLGALRILAVVAPLAVCGLVYLLGGLIAPSGAALLLVLLVVGAAATGDRWTGILAGLAGAAGFDFFLTSPYLDLHIANSEDLQLAVLLLLVGLAVSELALWGGRQRAVASERAGYIEGVLAIADLAAAGASRTVTADAVADRIGRVLGVEAVGFVPGPPASDSAVLDRDGRLHLAGLVLDVATDGLPTDRFTAVPVDLPDATTGHFRITSAASLVRVSAEQLRVVVLLADQFSAAAQRSR
ncbi:MAG: DUF4118 domain-containing protein [Propionicimonas sp.]